MRRKRVRVVHFAGSAALLAAMVMGTVAVPVATAQPDGVGAFAGVVSDGWGGVAGARSIRYTTESPTGATTIATGIVAVPSGQPPAGGWPIVSWEHGSRGLANQCGLTSLPGPDADIVRRFVDTGYAVVAPDFLGLGPGTQAPHPYQHSRTEATATVDLVRAARNADPRLSKAWAVTGVSQGGHAALNTGNIASSYAPELDFRGTVAMAPGSNIETILPLIGPQMPALPGTGEAVGVLAAVLAGMRSGAPDFDLGPYLTPAGSDLLDRLSTSCVLDFGKQVGSASFGSLLAQPLSSGPFPDRLRRYTAVPTTGYRQPILLAHGIADVSVPLPATLALAAGFRAGGVDFELRTYDADHQTIVDVAWPDTRAFLGRILPPR
ncbi:MULTISPECIES: lipase family protein [unclassified Nocardia]|uniref:lipase family protein n=1 Tax=unclassified Nocardia TaxID=2637762 RepID=UPI001CE481FB|nr:MULTISPECIES: lipase family protein [unclassified Nocardia]